MNIKRIKEIFKKIKLSHPYWAKGTLTYQLRIEKAIQPLMEELEVLGVDRLFSESLLFFGKAFVDSLRGDKEATIEGQAVACLEGQAIACLEDVEEIFGVKAEDMTDKERREGELAGRYGAFVYLSEPMKGDRVGIKVVSKV